MGHNQSKVAFLASERVVWDVSFEEFQDRFNGSMPDEDIKRLLEANGRIISVHDVKDKLVVQFEGFDTTFSVSRNSVKPKDPFSFANMHIGDLVRIDNDQERMRELQQQTCGYVDGMAHCRSKIGYVRGCDNQSVLVLTGATLWAWNPQLLVKLTDEEINQRKVEKGSDRNFNPYDLVQIMENMEELQGLQDGHGGWSERMTATVGQIGCVLEARGENGDLVVQISTKLFVFNRLACTKLVDASECGPGPANGGEVPGLQRLLQGPLGGLESLMGGSSRSRNRKPTDFLQTQFVRWNVKKEDFKRNYTGTMEDEDLDKLLEAKGRVAHVESRRKVHVKFEGAENVFMVSAGCLLAMDPPFGDKDNKPLFVGSLVWIFEDRSKCAQMQENFGGFNDQMGMCCGKLGYVQGCDSSSIRVLSGNKSFMWNPQLLTKVEDTEIQAWREKNADNVHFRPYDVVAFKEDDVAVIETAQEGHGGWDEKLNTFVSKFGYVLKIYGNSETGDLKVYFCSRNVRLNRELCSIVASADFAAPAKDWFEKVMKACNEGNVDKLKKWLDEGKLQKYMQDPRLLVSAAYKGQVEVATWLLEQGMPLEGADDDGDVPLHGACMNGQADMARLLIRRGVNVNCRNKKSITPLHWATRKAYPVVMDLLLEAGANLDMQDELGNTPLHNALRKSHRGMVMKLLAAGASLGKGDNDGVTALHLLTKDGGEDYLTAIQKSSSYSPLALSQVVNERHPSGSTALHIAIVNNHMAWFMLLYRVIGVDLNARDRQGLTPLHVAVISRNREVLLMLLKGDINPLSPETPTEDSFSMPLCPVDLNAADSSGNTPLLTAVRMHLATALKKSKSDMNLGEMERVFVKSWKEHRDAAVYLEFAELLTQSGAALHAANDNNETPLSLCEAIDPQFGARLRQIAKDSGVSTVLNPVSLTSTKQSIRDVRKGDPVLLNSYDDGPIREKLLRLDSLEEKLRCPICMTERIKVYFQCGHAACSQCEVRVERCPVCRENIVHRIVAKNL